MTLTEIKDWLKTELNADSGYTGKIDTSKTNVFCVYDRQSSQGKVCVGGMNNTSSWPKKICVLARGTTSYSESETYAQSIYDVFIGAQAMIGGHWCFFNMEFDGPVSAGADDKGVYEFTIDLTIIYQRKDD